MIPAPWLIAALAGRPRALPLGLPDTLAAMNPHGGAERHKKRSPR
jgi:hypothetical protein